MNKVAEKGEKRGVEACVLCGQCNPGSVAYTHSRDERRATRHVVWLARKRRDSVSLYACMLNGRAEERCPLSIGIDDAVIDARRRLVGKGFETVGNKKVVDKLMNGKNPYS